MGNLRVVTYDPEAKPQPKVARIEVELDDGTIKQWTGVDALAYVKTVDDILILHQVRAGAQLDMPKPTRTFRLPGAGVTSPKEKNHE